MLVLGNLNVCSTLRMSILAEKTQFACIASALNRQNVSRNIMTKILNTAFILLIILFSSCENKESETEFEKKAMTQIFSDLIDSTCIDSRIMLNFPPKYGKSIFDNQGYYIGVDSTKATIDEKQKLREWKQKELKIKNDTSKIIIAFDSKIKPSTENNLKTDFEKHFPGEQIVERNFEYKFNYENIRLNRKFVLRDISKFPNRDEIWKTNYNFVFSGVVYFTKIQFSKNKNYGILDGGFFCGGKCGQGYRIYIKKTQGKWVIDKIDETWIS